MQPVDVWRLECRVSVAGHVTVTLVIGHDEDDVRLCCGGCRIEQAPEDDQSDKQALARDFETMISDSAT